MNDEDIFRIAKTLSTFRQKDFLQENCEDIEQVDRLVRLLAADKTDDSLLDTTAMQLSEDAGDTPNLQKSIGDFEIARELGRGGMGVVYEARQRSLKRKVALKVLSSGLGLSSKAILRFRREAEAAGKLHHTNIVPIYTTGEDKGIHFYAMELIDGPSLDLVIKQRERLNSNPSDESLAETASRYHTAHQEENSPNTAKMSDEVSLGQAKVRGGHSGVCREEVEGGASSGNSSISTSTGNTYFDELATMIADVAEALDHAHEHGVIHRDIKPSNLLLGPDGRLSINDFGLARMLEQPGMTVSGEFVGSPLYMSPEQITAGRVQLDHRTDIYSLGATLYELLTHQPPFPGQTRDQVLSQILHKEPVPTRKLNRKIPIDLDTICMKAIDKDPDRRYQTAGQLADDLRKFVNRYAISARRTGVLGKALKYGRRNPLAVAFALFAICVATTGSLAWDLTRRQNIELQKTEVVDMAMRGDFGGARVRLSALEGNLSPGWLALLEGQILLYKGESEVLASDALTKATRLLPDDTAAKSLLAVSFFLSGKEDDYILQLKTVANSDADTFTEKLFKGYALHWFATADAITLLDEAIGMNRGYAIAYRFRGEALTISALNMRNREEALPHVERAIDDLTVASKMVESENLGNVNSLVYAYLTRGIIFKDLGNLLGSAEDFAKARSLAYSMRETWFASEDNMYSPLAFHFVTDTSEDFTSLLLNHSDALLSEQRPRQGYIEVKIPTFLFGDSTLPIEQRMSLANNVFAMAPSELRNLTQYVPAFVGTDDPKADRRTLLRDLQRDLPTRMRQHSGIYLLLDWIALRLLKADQAQLDEVASRIRKGYSEHFISPHREWGISLSDYMLRKIDERQLENQLIDSRSVSTYAYLAIAANHLAEGRRLEAKRALQQSVDEGFYMYYAPKWSKAFLRRVDDPNWLPWLRENSERSETD